MLLSNKIFLLALLVLFTSLFLAMHLRPKNKQSSQTTDLSANLQPISEDETKHDNLPHKGWISRDFTDFNNNFEFRAAFPSNWRIEYIKENSSLILFDPNSSASKPLDQAQIFINTNQKHDFSLPDNFHSFGSQDSKIKGHPSLLHDAISESQIQNENQPDWIVQQHQILEIQNSKQLPSTFFSFSKNPQLSNETFLIFVDSLSFYDDQNTLFPPLMNWQQRITKKPFGIHVSANNSPVQTERFSGYHTGTDFEIIDDELDQDVPVHAVCHGEIIKRERVEGYGGVIIQKCDIEQTPVFILYGHLSFSAEYSRDVGFYLTAGQLLTNLADDQSFDSGWERKHLHLAVHREQQIDLRGYVDNKSELTKWIDPESLIQR